MDCTLTIRGNVGSPIEFRSGETDGRKWARAEFRLANTPRVRRPDGAWVDGTTTWLTVEAWSALAEGVRASLACGEPVLVTGTLRTDVWTDGNGEPKTKVKLVADTIGHDLSRGRARFVKNTPIPEPAAPEEVAPAASGEQDEAPTVDLDDLAAEIERAVATA